MSFLTALKTVSNKINSIAKAMDDKVENFADQVLDIVESYDADFFANSADAEADRVDMKASIIKLFAMFQPEDKKPKNINGYILFCQENREDCIKRNPSMSPTDLTKALGVEWKALDDEERKTYNERAKLVAPQSEEQKKAKRAASKSSKKSESKQVTCDFSGCDKVVKNPTQHTDGCTYCATHFKKVVSDEKKASTPKCQHTSKDDKKCTSEAVNGEWCTRHMKKPSPSVSPVVAPVAKESETLIIPRGNPGSLQESAYMIHQKIQEDKKKSPKGFSFKSTVPVKISQNPEYWTCKSLKIEGEKYRFHKESGLVLYLSEDKLKGTYIDSKFTPLESLVEEQKSWAKQCGINVDEDDVEMELDEELESEEE